MCLLRHLIALFLLLGVPLEAQFATIDAPTSPLVGFSDGIILEDDGTSLQAFSAVTKEWTVLGASGTTLVELGDWVACVQRPNGSHAFFLARTGQVLTPPDTSQPILVANQRGAADELGYICYQLPNNNWRLYVCCPKGSAIWDLIPGTVHVPLAIGSALVLRQPLGGDLSTILGFSARTGYFEESSLIDNDDGLYLPVIEKNYCGYETSVGTYLFSAPMTTWTQFAEPDQSWKRGSLYVARFDGPGGTASYGCYSPYTASFVQGVFVQAGETSTLMALGEHVVCVRVNSDTYHGIGSYPQQSWKEFTVANGSVTACEDGFVIFDGANQVAHGFSGLVVGNFVSEPLPGFAVTTTVPVDGFIPLRYQSEVAVYNPTRHEFTAPIDLLGGVPNALRPGDSVLAAQTATNEFRCYHMRSGSWSVPVNLGPNFAAAVEGSTVMFHRPTQGLATAYDSKGNRFLSQSISATATIDAHGSLGVAADVSGQHFFSQLNARWTQVFDGVFAIPSGSTQRTLRGEVASIYWNGRLTAIGAPGDHHVWYDHPDNGQLNRMSLPNFGQPFYADTTIKAPVGSILFHYYSSNRLTNGVPLSGVINGTLFLPTPVALDIVAQTSPVQTYSIALPSSPSDYYQAWLQSAIFTPGGSPAIRLTDTALSLVVF